MDEHIIKWLLENNNPAVKYRTQTEILSETADKTPVVAWIHHFLPTDWMERRGLWSAYYLNTFAECGLAFEDTGINKSLAIGFSDGSSFNSSCEDFMRLRALARLGLGSEPPIASCIDRLSKRQLPDGGFLCQSRLDKFLHTPKSCVKANLHALLFCAECKKGGFKTNIEEKLLEYFWNHNLFYRTDNKDNLILNTREGWRAIDTFYPFEVMRVGVQNIIESLCALGFGCDPRMKEAWNLLNSKKDACGMYRLDGTLSKSYLPKEQIGKPSKWITLYALLAQK